MNTLRTRSINSGQYFGGGLALMSSPCPCPTFAIGDVGLALELLPIFVLHPKSRIEFRAEEI